eukprot:3741368-Pyramimonas_sp.AAC.1
MSASMRRRHGCALAQGSMWARILRSSGRHGPVSAASTSADTVDKRMSQHVKGSLMHRRELGTIA